MLCYVTNFCKYICCDKRNRLFKFIALSCKSMQQYFYQLKYPIQVLSLIFKDYTLQSKDNCTHRNN